MRSRLAAPLRGVLRLANAVLAALSLAVVGASLYMALKYHRGGLIPPAPPIAEPPPPGETLLQLDGPTKQGSSGSPWFIYAVFGAGLYLLVTATTGLSGLRSGNRRRLVLYITLLTGAILGEAAVLLLLFAAGSWRSHLPPDASGWLDAALAFADANARLVKLIGLSALLAQLLTLGAACWLGSIYQQAYDDWLDDVEDRRERAWQALGRSAERSYATGGADSAWGARMRGKYGVQSSEFAQAAARARQAAALAGDSPA